MDEPKTYHIKTVQDFLSVPADRREVCIREFRHWCDAVEAMMHLVDTLDVTATAPDEYTWIDDGKHTMKGIITDGNEDFVVVEGVIPGFGDKR